MEQKEKIMVTNHKLTTTGHNRFGKRKKRIFCVCNTLYYTYQISKEIKKDEKRQK